MPIPELTPLQKYEQFRNSRPQYKKMSFSQVCSIMVKQKILTSAEAQELSKSLFSGGFNSNSTTDWMSSSTYEPFGLSLNNQNNKPKPSNYVELQKNIILL